MRAVQSLEHNVYAICLKAQRTGSVQVGALGQVGIDNEWIYYAGRASRGWGSRMKRFQKNFTRHWHVDYLVNQEWINIEGILPVNRPAEYECKLSRNLGGLDEMEPLKDGFGASDCAENCKSHGWSGPLSPEALFDQLDKVINSKRGWWKFNGRACRWTTIE